ncbi:MAG: hypothetical protein A2V70_12300, partial [Planctomycetes bacterium RBG_13_63_9]
MNDKRSYRNRLSATLAALVVLSMLTDVALAQQKLEALSEGEIAKITEALPEKATATPAKPRKILIFWRCEGFFHSSIPRCNKALELMGETTGAYASVVSDDMAMFDPGGLDSFDAVVLNNTTQLKFENPAHRETLMKFVQGGKGLCGIHAATDNFPTWPEGAAMMGGLFNGHPWGGGGTWAMKLDEPDHPINKGFGGKGFWISDEIYRMKDPYTRENLRVLVSLDMTKEVNQNGSREDRDNAISWIRPFGKGRVFYCSLGHNHEVFQRPAVLQHYLDGIQFALGDLKVDATP